MTDEIDFANDSQNIEPKKKRGNPAWHKGMAPANPSGRPKLDLEFRHKCKRLVSEKVAELWADEIEKRGPKWVECSKLLAEYAFGKPHQTSTVEIEATVERPLENVDGSLLVEQIKKGSKA